MFRRLIHTDVCCWLVLSMFLVMLLSFHVPVFAETVEALTQRAQSGDARAQVELGLMYEDGSRIEQSDSKAFHWIEKSARAGDALGQFYLGWLYANGYGTPQDNLQAYLWFHFASEQGYEDAADQKAALLPNLTPEELAEVRQLTGEAVTQAAPSVQNKETAAVVSEYGRDYLGLRRAYNQKHYEVIPLVRQLASSGDPEAQNLLGYHLLRLARANPEDETLPREAFSWFLQAARQGNVAAQYNIGVCFLEGVGVHPSAASAVTWFTSARDRAAVVAGMPSYQDATREFREASEYSDRYAAAMQGYASARRELNELIQMRLQESKARRGIE